MTLSDSEKRGTATMAQSGDGAFVRRLLVAGALALPGVVVVADPAAATCNPGRADDYPGNDFFGGVLATDTGDGYSLAAADIQNYFPYMASGDGTGTSEWVMLTNSGAGLGDDYAQIGWIRFDAADQEKYDADRAVFVQLAGDSAY